jgi:hypothetical protein
VRSWAWPLIQKRAGTTGKLASPRGAFCATLHRISDIETKRSVRCLSCGFAASSASPRCMSPLSPAALWRGFFSCAPGNQPPCSPLMQRGLLISPSRSDRSLCEGPSGASPPFPLRRNTPPGLSADRRRVLARPVVCARFGRNPLAPAQLCRSEADGTQTQVSLGPRPISATSRTKSTTAGRLQRPRASFAGTCTSCARR